CCGSMVKWTVARRVLSSRHSSRGREVPEFLTDRLRYQLPWCNIWRPLCLSLPISSSPAAGQGDTDWKDGSDRQGGVGHLPKGTFLKVSHEKGVGNSLHNSCPSGFRGRDSIQGIEPRPLLFSEAPLTGPGWSARRRPRCWRG